MPRDKSADGNAMQGQLNFDRDMMRKGISLSKFSVHLDKIETSETGVTSVRFKAPTNDSAEWFAVVSYVHEGEALVAFHSAETFLECVTGLCNRFVNQKLKWKVDEYAK